MDERTQLCYNARMDKFEKYIELLLEWNKKINLTRIIEPSEIKLKHFNDSLTIEKFIDKNAKIIDVGTGAGFPGIPLKIIRNDVDLTLLDSINKRIEFLKTVCSELNLEANCIHNRAEMLGNDIAFRETFDIAISRAVADLSSLAEYMLPLVRIGGKVIAMKSDKAEEEVKNAESIISALGGGNIRIEKIKLNEEIARFIVIIEKTNPTPDKFPRKPKLIGLKVS